jgi:nitroimidazol reductase NimA-like FMN-containing flavoprotein (pyridoxamine 5'-phosphate oxidase superfamily)
MKTTELRKTTRTARVPQPSFRPLDEPGVREVLTRNHVGRLAFSHGTYVDIEPIHYVFADDIVYFRTAPGSKLVTLTHNQWVAFEVDEVEGTYDWRSVVLHGVVHVIEDGTLPEQHAAYARAVARLRTFLPQTFRKNDPTPFRSVIVQLHVQAATGRAATTKAKTR